MHGYAIAVIIIILRCTHGHGVDMAISDIVFENSISIIFGFVHGPDLVHVIVTALICIKYSKSMQADSIFGFELNMGFKPILAAQARHKEIIRPTSQTNSGQSGIFPYQREGEGRRHTTHKYRYNIYIQCK